MSHFSCKETFKSMDVIFMMVSRTTSSADGSVGKMPFSEEESSFGEKKEGP